MSVTPHVVSLPEAKEPEFPAACIACGREPAGIYSVALGFSRKETVSAPACAACLSKLANQAQRRSVMGVLVVILLLGGFLLLKRTYWPELSLVPFAAIALGLVVAATVAMAWFERTRPRPLTVAVARGFKEFRFTERSAAVRFALKNDVAVHASSPQDSN